MSAANRSTVNPAQADKFTSAVECLAQTLGVPATDDPMPISKFKSDYRRLLKAALNGSVQQICLDAERFVLLTEKQVILLSRPSSRRNSLADTLASIQAPDMPLNASLAMVPGSELDQYPLMGSGSSDGRG